MIESPQLDIHNRGEIASRYTDWLHKGVPTLGWAGDPDLVLVYAHGAEQRWELWIHTPRRDNPDYHSPVLSAPPGAELNDNLVFSLIQRLVAGDTHRKDNSELEQFERLMKENDRKEAVRKQESVEALSDPLDKFYYEAGKTFGVTKTFFPT